MEPPAPPTPPSSTPTATPSSSTSIADPTPTPIPRSRPRHPVLLRLWVLRAGLAGGVVLLGGLAIGGIGAWPVSVLGGLGTLGLIHWVSVVRGAGRIRRITEAHLVDGELEITPAGPGLGLGPEAGWLEGITADFAAEGYTTVGDARLSHTGVAASARYLIGTDGRRARIAVFRSAALADWFLGPTYSVTLAQEYDDGTVVGTCSFDSGLASPPWISGQVLDPPVTVPELCAGQEELIMNRITTHPAPSPRPCATFEQVIEAERRAHRRNSRWRRARGGVLPEETRRTGELVAADADVVDAVVDQLSRS